MTIKLPNDVRLRLVRAVAATLGKARVTSNALIDRASIGPELLASAILKKDQKVRNILQTYISAEPFLDFFVGVLDDELLKQDRYSVGAPDCLLTDIEEYADVEAAAERLVRSLESIPWEYELYVALNPELTSALGAVVDEEYALGRAAALVHGGYASKDRLGDSAFRVTLLSGPPLVQDRIYFRARVAGYIPIWAAGGPAEDALLRLRAFFGLGLAEMLLALGPHKSFTALGPTRAPLLVYRLVGEAWQLQHEEHLSMELSDAFVRLTMEPDISAEGTEALTRWTRTKLARLAAIFEHDNNDSVLLAAAWLFDSWASNNELLGYVQAAVALEALLGGQEHANELSLTQRLANRAAYLLASTSDERSNLLRLVTRLYGTRSGIVHSGKWRLTSEERADLI